MSNSIMKDPANSIRLHLQAGLVFLLLLGGGVGAWAATTQIAGAVIAAGTVVVDMNVQKVQHPTGGIIGEIRARDGQHVKLGDIVVRLDETLTRANLAIVTKGLDEHTARKARLEAERDGKVTVAFPADLLERNAVPEVDNVLAGEQRLFELRRTAREGQKSRLQERIGQLMEEIGGLAAQSKSKLREVALIEKELAGARELWNKNLMPITKLTALERDATRLEGEGAQLVAAIAQAKGRVTETDLQIIQIDRDLASEVGKELRDVESKIGELIERRVTALDQLKRIDVRAPQTGTVHQSTVHTVGGVITAGEPIMLIVPATDNLMVEVKIPPQDIDQLKLGQRAVIRFAAFQRTTPELNGTVNRISADAVADARTPSSYYTVRVALSADEIARLGEIKLIPGMPVEAFIQTGYRTVISYLVKPLDDQIKRAFRER